MQTPKCLGPVCPTLCSPMDCRCQVLLSMDSRQEYWSELPFLTLGDLPDPRIKPVSLVSPTLAGRFFITAPPGKLYQDLKNTVSPTP